MKLSLRFLFWLILMAAIAVCWAMERRQLSQQYEPEEWKWTTMSVPAEIIGLSIERQQKLASIKTLSNQELASKIRPSSVVFPIYDHERQLYLTEMVNRGMQTELAIRDKTPVMAGTKVVYLGYSTTQLTALRRTQGKPDPLKIHVEVPTEDAEGKPANFPRIVATLQNVDSEQLHYSQGGDSVGGRSERWRVHLTDEAGKRVPDSNLLVVGFSEDEDYRILEPGQKLESPIWLDARGFVKPPKSGRYTLQLIHSDNYIAEDPDLTGLIVWKSDPVPVIVRNHGPENYSWSGFPLAGILLLGVVAITWAEFWPRPPGNTTETPRNRRGYYQNMLAAVLALALIAIWTADSYYYCVQIRKYRPDSEASWTMQLAAEAGS